MKTARIYTDDFNRIIGATKGFVSINGNREAFKYIKLEFNAEKQSVTAVAVDGFRMSVEHSVCDCEEDFVVYVKSNIKLPNKQYVKITLEESNEVILRCNDFVFGYQQPQPYAFDYEKVIPNSEPNYKIGFNGNYLLSALQAAKISLGKSFKEPVILEFRGTKEAIVLRTNKDDIKLILPMTLKE